VRRCDDDGVVCTSRERHGARREERDARGGRRDTGYRSGPREQLAAVGDRTEQAKPGRPQRRREDAETAEYRATLRRAFELGPQRAPRTEEERGNCAR
jgi:hypothetical protein